MAERGRPPKKRPKLTPVPQFVSDEELDITELQAAFVWHYTEGACGQTEAARRAGFSFPGAAASKMLNGVTFPSVTRAVRIKQDDQFRERRLQRGRVGRERAEPIGRADGPPQPEPEHQR